MDFGKYNLDTQECIRNILENRGVHAKNTLQHGKKLYEYAKKINDEALMGFSSYYMGEAYYILNNVEKLFESITGALSNLSRTEQWELLARSYNLLGITSVNRGNASFAMDYYLNALSYCNYDKIPDVEILIHMNIGSLYHSLGEYEEARNYYERGYQILKQAGKIQNCEMYLLHYNIGMADSYLYQKRYDKADFYRKKAVEESDGKRTQLEELSLCCFEARLYHVIGNQKERDICIKKIDVLLQAPIEILSVFDDLYVYCEMLLDANQYRNFQKVFSILEKFAIEAKITYLRKQLVSLKIGCDKKMGDRNLCKEDAMQYYELNKLMGDENRYTIMNMVNVRKFLEESKRQTQAAEEQNRILKKRSETDALTGLFNRFRLNTYAEDAFINACKLKKEFAIEILDVDYFKQYNDNYGHQAGDDCLKQIANEIKELIKGKNIFGARYGGDEFILIYEGYKKADVQNFAKKLKQNIVNLEIEHRYSKASSIVTISQGICFDIPKEENKIWDYLHMADSMLYQVKQKQRNDVCIATFMSK